MLFYVSEEIDKVAGDDVWLGEIEYFSILKVVDVIMTVKKMQNLLHIP